MMKRTTVAAFAALLCFAVTAFGQTVDMDHDGLSAAAEATLGTSDSHKDLFVYIDWLVVNGRSYRPRAGFVKFVTQFYAEAPNMNPDGTTGIRLHIQFGHGIPTTVGTIGYMYRNTAGLAYSWSDFDTIKSRSFPASKWPTHHYTLFAATLGDENGQPLSISGISRNGPNMRAGASDFLVTLGGGWWNKPKPARYWLTQSGTFCHELGHNLGLRHGGPDSIGYKPNLLSVMNYAFQTDGFPYWSWDGQRYVMFDYSRKLLPPLNENQLYESRGIGAQAYDEGGVWGTTWYVWNGSDFASHTTWDGRTNIDWNTNGTVNTGPVKLNINQDYNVIGGYMYHKYTVLRSMNEWPNVVFRGGYIGKTDLSKAAVPAAATFEPCLDYRQYSRMIASRGVEEREATPATRGQVIERAKNREAKK